MWVRLPRSKLEQLCRIEWRLTWSLAGNDSIDFLAPQARSVKPDIVLRFAACQRRVRVSENSYYGRTTYVWLITNNG